MIVYRCHRCDWIQSEEEPDLKCARCGESREWVEMIEVVPKGRVELLELEIARLREIPTF